VSLIEEFGTFGYTIVEYALQSSTSPIGLATYRTVRELPRELRDQLPGPEEIARLLEDGE
jgi:hypothetical protein